MKNILVTGAAGFIGSHVSAALLERGDFVIGIDNFDDYYSPLLKEKNSNILHSYSDFTLYKADIRDKNKLSEIFEQHQITHVVHLAARAGVRPSIAQPELYYDVNVTGTLTLLEVMRAYNCTKMAFASSSSVYGNNKKVPFSEEDNVDFPISPYAATKKAGELICHTYCHLYGFDISCLRFFTVFGPRQRPEMAIHQFADAILRGKEITLFGDGSTRRDYTFISDIVQGIRLAVDNLQGYEVYNLGESQTISLVEMVQTIEKFLEIPAIIRWENMQPGDVEQTFADISKATWKLGYKPATKFEDGIREFCAWKKQEFLLELNKSNN